MEADQCLVVGCGYLGSRVARAWKERGLRVFVTTRSEAKAAQFVEDGYQPILLNIAEPIAPSSLPPVRYILFAVGFDRSDVHSQEQVYVQGLENVLQAISSRPERFIYISTTGVYGQADGAWVDESSLTEPVRDGGRLCLKAERLLRQHSLSPCSVSLRLAGIYGPQRVPFLQKLRDEKPLPVATEGYLNLIHVDDAARVVTACTIETESPQLLAVSDGTPVIRRTYYDTVAQLIGRKATYAAPDFSSARTQRALGSKRVRNDLMIESLRLKLLYPSYKQGLTAILADMNAS